MKNLVKTVLVLLLLPATLLAGQLQLPETGQSGCWDSSGNPVACGGTGQDGELAVGAAWPVTRFTVNNEQTVTDNLTGLIWNRDPASYEPAACGYGGTSRSWQQAFDYVSCLNNNAYLGFTDWRIPNVAEMRSLINIGQALPYNWLNNQGFINIDATNYWTSTSYAKDPAYAWYVNMNYGYPSGHMKSTELNVWPVRGQLGNPSTIVLPETGQYGCWDNLGNPVDCAGTGQDGDLLAGDAWPTPRFAVTLDETVSDNLTGLVWTRNPVSPGPAACTTGIPLGWQQAFDLVSCLNSNNYLGYVDWRLPNRVELESIVNLQAADSYEWLNSQGFTSAANMIYWSSDTFVSKPDEAWAVYINDGCSASGLKTSNFYVWPVRGGRESLLTVVLSGTGRGDIAPDPGHLNWIGNTGTGSFTEDAVVTLWATANSGSSFAGWGGACTGTSEWCEVTMASAQYVTASFVQTAFEIVVSPAFLTVPAIDFDGAYRVSWGASSTSNPIYILEESTSSDFTTGVQTVYTGSRRVIDLSGRNLATRYYYRVKAVKEGYVDSDWTNAATPVANACARPGAIAAPGFDADGSYTVSWVASDTPGVTYTVHEATDLAFSTGLHVVYVGPSTSINITDRVADKTYYYRVRASIGESDLRSTWTTRLIGTAVPGGSVAAVPGAVTVPEGDEDGNFTVNWAPSATPGAEYVVQEAQSADFSFKLKTFTVGTSSSYDATGRIPGRTYYYRVRAVLGGMRDSVWSTCTNGCSVVAP